MVGDGLMEVQKPWDEREEEESQSMRVSAEPGEDAFASEGPRQNKLTDQPHDWVLTLSHRSPEDLPSVKGDREDVCRPTSCHPNNTRKTSTLFPQRR